MREAPGGRLTLCCGRSPRGRPWRLTAKPTPRRSDNPAHLLAVRPPSGRAAISAAVCAPLQTRANYAAQRRRSNLGGAEHRFRARRSFVPGPTHGAHITSFGARRERLFWLIAPDRWSVMARSPAGCGHGVGRGGPPQETGALLALSGVGQRGPCPSRRPGSRVFVVAISVSLTLVPGDARARRR